MISFAAVAFTAPAQTTPAPRIHPRIHHFPRAMPWAGSQQAFSLQTMATCKFVIDWFYCRMRVECEYAGADAMNRVPTFTAEECRPFRRTVG